MRRLRAETELFNNKAPGSDFIPIPAMLYLWAELSLGCS